LLVPTFVLKICGKSLDYQNCYPMKLIPFFLAWLVSASLHAEGYLLFEENGKKGIKNEQGQVVIPASFDALGWSDGSFSVIGQTTGYRLKEQWGLINLNKEFITQPLYTQLIYKSGEYIIARKKINPIADKVGCISLRGEMRIPFVYDGIEINGLRAIVFNLKGAHFEFGLVNLQNQVIIPLQYKNIASLGTLRYAVQNRDNKIALFSEDGKSITDFSIDSLSQFYKGYSIIYQKGLQGLINREGEIKLPTHYSRIKITETGAIQVQLPGEWKYLNHKNEELSKIIADDLVSVSQHRSIIFLGGKYGLLDERNRIILPLQWSSMQEVKPSVFLVGNKNKLGVIDADGKSILPLVYDSIKLTPIGYRLFEKNEGWQLANTSGEIITQKKYETLNRFNGSSWVVLSRGFYGVVNTKGEEFIHCVFDSIGDRTSNYVAVKFKKQYGIIDHRENWKLAPQAFPIQLANDACYLIREKENSFLKSFDGKVISFTPYRVKFEPTHWVEILPDGRQNKFDYNGMRYVPVSFASAEAFATPSTKEFQLSEGLLGIRRDDKFGFVDARGSLVIANRYDSVADFREGLAPVKLIGKWGFLNKQDQLIIQPNYEAVTPFYNGFSIVKRNGKTGVINVSGKPVLDVKYESIQRLPDGKFLFKIKGLFGLASATGLILIEARFDHLAEVKSGFLLVSQAGKWGLLTTDGIDVIPLFYDKLEYHTANDHFLAMRNPEWREILPD
jgi:hypothetical protein